MESQKGQEPAWQLAVKIISLLVAIIAIIWFIQKIAWVIGLLIVATLIVYSISPLSNYLTAKGFPHSVSVLTVYTFLLCSVVIFFYLLIPTLLVELRALSSYLATDYRSLLPQLLGHIDDILASDNINQALQDFAKNLPDMLLLAVITLTGLTGNIFSGLTEVIIVLFLVYYLLRDLSPIKQGIIRLCPVPWRKETLHVLKIIDLKVGAYLRGNILRCGIVGFVTGMALAIVGMPFALMLGVLAGVLNIIAYVGPYLAGIPAVLLAVAPDTPHPILIILIYVLIQAMDGFLLVPLLLGKAVDLRPFTVIVSLLIGGILLGIIGVILAIPAAATLKVIITHYYLREGRTVKL
ncbi:MAG: AI-2E family transporter [Bacillota bacterium]|nr:AI-2E family transporter [Bacillota bacterium]MDW7684146.1 AI-2E family transporter [Bacillota bacterium]